MVLCDAGHWLGLDTHDCRHVAYDTPLVPGVVLTIEPGLYVPANPARHGSLAGIGVRIEDDVVVTQVPFLFVYSCDYVL